MATQTVTITGKTGPGITVTAAAFTGVLSLLFDYGRSVIQMMTDQGPKEFQYSNIATVTVTISGGNTAITIST